MIAIVPRSRISNSQPSHSLGCKALFYLVAVRTPELGRIVHPDRREPRLPLSNAISREDVYMIRLLLANGAESFAGHRHLLFCLLGFADTAAFSWKEKCLNDHPRLTHLRARVILLSRAMRQPGFSRTQQRVHIRRTRKGSVRGAQGQRSDLCCNSLKLCGGPRIQVGSRLTTTDRQLMIGLKMQRLCTSQRGVHMNICIMGARQPRHYRTS